MYKKINTTFISKPLLRMENFLKRTKPGRYVVLNVWSRRSTILKIFVGFEVLIHTGRKLFKLRVNKRMVGHKFGEFAFTKRMSSVIHFQKKKKKKLKKKRGI